MYARCEVSGYAQLGLSLPCLRFFMLVTLANSEDPDGSIPSGSVLFAEIKTIFRYIHVYAKISTCDPINYKMDKSMLIISICVGKIHQNERVKADLKKCWFAVLLLTPFRPYPQKILPF